MAMHLSVVGRAGIQGGCPRKNLMAGKVSCRSVFSGERIGWVGYLVVGFLGSLHGT